MSQIRMKGDMVESQSTSASLKEKACEAAARLLEKRGYQIVERDWRCEEGGFDIAATRGNLATLACIVAREGNAADFRGVDAPEQREKRALGAQRFIEERGMGDVDVRTEVIGVHLWGADRAIVHRWQDDRNVIAERKSRDIEMAR